MRERHGVKLALGGLALAVSLCSMHISAATMPDSAATGLVYVGSQGRQIQAARFDAASGKLTLIGPVAEGLRPTWVLAHPQLPVLYAVNDDSASEGSVSAYAVERGSGALRKLNEVSTGGNGSTHLSLDLPSMTLLAANFASGSASSIALNPDGSMGALVSTLKASGSGPHRRQASPHGHGSAVDPSGRYALVSDLGADRLFVYGFDRATRVMTPDAAARSFAAPPGSGPRHVVFAPNGKTVYLINELSAELMALRWDAHSGRLTLLQSLPTSSPEFAGVKSAAEVAVSRDGRFVYVDNRGENALVVYRVDPDSGELALQQRISSGGELPWGFALHPSGKWLLVANQRSARVNVFSIDGATGKLADTGQAIETPTPVSITFVN
ncbi:lactonase family protein [Oxalobacteraceae bacterium]|nr:lactonase family protein [Oxalobacteraceae bacterium]